MEEVQLVYQKVKTLYENLRKSSQRPWSLEYIAKKTQQKRGFVLEFNNITVEETDIEYLKYREAINEFIKKINCLLEAKQEEALKKSEDNEKKENKMATITFRDIEQSLDRFDGVVVNVETWLASFEATSVLYEWTEVQKYIFCRQLLVDAAKIAVQGKTTINSYVTLKAYLLDEFKTEINSATIHDKLRTIRKSKNESAVMFGYRVQALANSGGVDERATLTYIVKGIGAQLANRAAMLTATSWKELKAQLVSYDEARSMEEQERPPEVRSVVRPDRRGPSTMRSPQIKAEPKPIKCFNCGAGGHISRDCRKPACCFQCGEAGHRAVNCPRGAGPSRA